MKIGSGDINILVGAAVRVAGLVPQSQSYRETGAAADPIVGPEVGGGVVETKGETPEAGPEKAGKGSNPGAVEVSRVIRQFGQALAGTRDDQQLNRRELVELHSLRKRDRAVRSHEQAHRAAGAGLVTGGSYSYERGPDGNRYAVAGEVQIDIYRESTPRATIIKMGKVKRAALAPVDPSSQDQRVAAQADRIMARARREMNNNIDPGMESGKPLIDILV